ncbi:MAG: SDR family oxidoreductase [Gemmatimonadales bacterium]
MAAALRADGATVVRAARSLSPEAPPGELHVAADLATDEGVAAVAAAVEPLGVPDLIVSSAGGFALGALEDTPVATLDQLYRVNLRAPFELAHRFLPLMRARGRGRHVLIGSIADYRAMPGNSAYAATKFGARGLHEVLREEYRGTGVLCTLVSPGPVDTALWDPFDPDHRTDLPSRAQMLAPADVAEAVRWIAAQPSHVDVAWLQLGPA